MSAPSSTLFKKTPIRPLAKSAEAAPSKDSAYWNSFEVRTDYISAISNIIFVSCALADYQNKITVITSLQTCSPYLLLGLTYACCCW